MGFLKKYASLFLPIVILIIAGVLFVPTHMMRASIREQMEDSARDARELERLLRDAVPQEQWKIEQEYQQEHAEDVNEIERLAVQTTLRELIYYGLFPDPCETSTQIYTQFGRKYRGAIDGLIEMMNAGEAPSDVDLSRILGESYERSRRGSISSRYSRRGSEENDPIIDAYCRERAQEIGVYANPISSFTGYDFWEKYEYQGPDVAMEDCWFAQVGYWIHEDIAKTIAALNSGSENVLDAKVKRLLGVRFETSVADEPLSEGYQQRPAYIRSEGDGLVRPWTGRMNDDDIDVVQFSLAVIVRADAIGDFTHELCSGKEHVFKGWEGNAEAETYVHNQITILQESFAPVDLESSEHELYRYGQDAVMRLDLICEYIFKRAAYDEIKPERIKLILGQNEEAEEE